MKESMKQILKATILIGILICGIYQTLEAKQEAPFTGDFSLANKFKVDIYEGSSPIKLFPNRNNHRLLALSNSGFSSSLFWLNEEGAGKTKAKVERPPLNWGRVAGEIAVGGLSGYIAGFGFASLAYLASGKEGGDAWVAAGYSALIGLSIGSALGVYFIGTRGKETGSFIATLLGSIIGFAGPMLIFPRDRLDRVSVVFILASSSVGATIAFNMSRRYKTNPALSEALVGFRDGKLTINFPAVSLQPSSYAKGIFNFRASLAAVEF
ncbi:MAG: hypothetical protein JW747_00900 [Candidatus Aminicenantes bacterium]|nr:hypothetical protein [Candidatus Aminicenantes bacterium]